MTDRIVIKVELHASRLLLQGLLGGQAGHLRPGAEELKPVANVVKLFAAVSYEFS
jgi:hypothetical protein